MGFFVKVILGLSLAVILLGVGAGFLGAVARTNHDAQSTATSEVKTCSTDLVGACAFVLSAVNFAYNTAKMTVTETSPGSGDRTAKATVGYDRQTITMTTLTPSTNYQFTVAYDQIRPGVTSLMRDVYRFTVPAMVIAIVVIVAAAVVMLFIRREGA